MNIDPLVKDLCDHLDQLKANRSQWETDWRDIKRLVHVNSHDFSYSNRVPEVDPAKDIYDGTAPWALDQFAAGVHSSVTNPASRWFNLEVRDVPRELIDDWDTLLWLENTSSVLHALNSKAEAMLNSSLHEMYLDIGAYGTGIIYHEYNRKTGGFSYVSCPLADCWIQESSDGLINTVFRLRRMTKNQIIDKFPDAPLPERVAKEKSYTTKFDVYHAVRPRRHRDLNKRDNTNMEYESVWFMDDPKHMLKESGYDYFPYYSPRWSKLAGQNYGRSPAHTCLPTIRMINKAEYVIQKGAEKIVDPPIQLASEGFMLPINTVPSGLIFREEGVEPAIPLETRGRVEIGLEMQEQKREHIIKSFFVDWILQQKNNTEMTATEVMDRRDEKLRMMAPMTARIEAELCGPLVKNGVFLALKHNLIDPPTDFIMQNGLDISYSSPASEAQRSGKSMGNRRFIESIVPLAEFKPETLDAIDFDSWIQDSAKLNNASPRIIRSPQAIAQIREQRQQQEQAAQAAAVAKDAASATKDMAQAQQLSLE